MSYVELQAATTRILRSPEILAGDVTATLEQYDLTAAEKKQILALTKEPLAEKFSRNMRSLRFHIATKALRTSRHFLGEELVSELYFNDFEPQALKVSTYHLAFRFMHFLSHDESIRSKFHLEDYPFLLDLLQYEAAEAYLRCYRRPALWSDESKNLRHLWIHPLALRYDIPTFLKKLLAENKHPLESGITCTEKPAFYLLIQGQSDDHVPLFEIDRATFGFLMRALGGETLADIPNSYADLVEAGICVPIPKRPRPTEGRSKPVPDALIQEIRNSVAETGYWKSPGPISEDQYEVIATLLGGEVSRENVRIEESGYHVHGSKGLALHTDDFSAGFICWYCKVPADSGGATEIIDTSRYREHFSEEEWQALTKIAYPRMGYAAHHPDSLQPLLTLREGHDWFSFNPWAEPRMKDDPFVKAAFEKLKRVITESQGSGLAIRLEKGEVLIIDNRRMLHGRADIPEGSKRHLLRRLVCPEKTRYRSILVDKNLESRLADYMKVKGLTSPLVAIAEIVESQLSQ